MILLRCALATVALALVPFVAGAQAGPAVPLDVRFPPSGPAGIVSTAQAGMGLRVVGRATVTVPADRMDVVVRLSPRGVSYAALDGLAKSVADAMRGAGIADARVALPLLGFLGPGSQVAVLGTIAHPTRPSVEATLRSTLAAAAIRTARSMSPFRPPPR